MYCHGGCGHVQMYEAEERQKAEDKRQEELRQQYLKEQELYKSK